MSAPEPERPQEARASLHKFEAARARLILERPFVGALVMHLDLKANARVRTVGTDARSLWFNPGYVATLSFAETQFVLAHEALHCALGHFHRRKGRLRGRWDRACDFCVNQLLVDDGLRPPPGILLDLAYRGMAAEEIYPLLVGDGREGVLDDHVFAETGSDEGAVRVDRETSLADRMEIDDAFLDAHRDGFDEVVTRGVTQVPAERLASAWQDRLAAAALEAAQVGRLGPGFRDAVGHLVQPRLPWRALLARFLMAVAREDYGFTRPSRREGEALLPALRSGSVDLVLALDTSGSVSREDFREFVEEVDALKGQISARVTLLACDAELAPGAPWRFEPWQPIELPPDLAGGGGTRFTPVFEWVAGQGMRPDALLYFTDAQGECPERDPDYPVLWLVKGSAPVPWGERIQLN